MTDEERQKLVARFRAHGVVMWTDIDLAAAELERLAEELRITNKALSMCSDECNKLYERYDKKLDEIERLAKEVARLKDGNGVMLEQCQNMLDMMVRLTQKHEDGT